MAKTEAICVIRLETFRMYNNLSNNSVYHNDYNKIHDHSGGGSRRAGRPLSRVRRAYK